LRRGVQGVRVSGHEKMLEVGSHSRILSRSETTNLGVPLVI
jgi:hypothetical protein